jgi:hypothetical protein
MSIIPALGRLRQNDFECTVTLGYIARPRKTLSQKTANMANKVITTENH